jgi:hypothetical protein
MTQVKCRVEPCFYWKDGDICGADSIMVDYNSQNATTTRMEAGDVDFNVRGASGPARGFADFETGDLTGTVRKTKTNKGGDRKTKSSEETLCSTFRPKNAEPRH